MNAVHDLTAENVGIYPNPNRGLFEIQFNAPTPDVYVFTVTNLLGQEIGKGLISKGTTVKSLELPNVAKGLYILKIYDTARKTLTIKLFID